MRSKIILVLFVLTVALWPDITHAQNTTGSANLRDTIKTRAATITKDNLQEVKAMYREKRSEFKTRVQTIQNTRKKALVQRIDTKIATYNKTVTDKLITALNKLASILDRIKTASASYDDQSLTEAIENADSSIAKAKEALSLQSEKEYIGEINDEASLRSDIGQIVSAFRSDIKEAHTTVIDAKQAVMNAARELAKLGGINNETNPRTIN